MDCRGILTKHPESKYRRAKKHIQWVNLVSILSTAKKLHILLAATQNNRYISLTYFWYLISTHIDKNDISRLIVNDIHVSKSSDVLLHNVFFDIRTEIQMIATTHI